MKRADLKLNEDYAVLASKYDGWKRMRLIGWKTHDPESWSPNERERQGVVKMVDVDAKGRVGSYARGIHNGAIKGLWKDLAPKIEAEQAAKDEARRRKEHRENARDTAAKVKRNLIEREIGDLLGDHYWRDRELDGLVRVACLVRDLRAELRGYENEHGTEVS